MSTWIRVGLIWLALCVSSNAFAQTNDAAARALFEDGRALMDQGEYAKACAKFEGSQKLGAKASTALNLGICYDKLNKFATAWSTFSTAAALAKREGHAERQAFAREQVAAMEAKLARLTITVGTSVQGLEVTLDDKPVIPAMFGTALPIDPGKHRIVAIAPGKKAWNKEVIVPAEQANLTETIPLLEDDASAPVPGPVPSPTPTPPATPDPDPPPTPASTTSPLVYIGFSLGGVGLAVGGIAGIVALANASTIRDNCRGDDNTQCPSSESDNISSAETVANVSNVGFAVGAAGVILGVVGLFLGGSEPAPSEAYIRPTIGVGAFGVEGVF